MIKLKIKYGNSQTDLRFPCTEKEMNAALERIHAEDVTPLELYVSEVVFPEELAFLQDRFVNLDEVNFLGKRMDSFFGDEEYQFYEAMKLEGFDTLPDLINLSFNLNRYPLIRDIGDMGKIGREYLLTVNGCIPAHDEDDPKYAQLGRELIQSGNGIFTEHGMLFVDENTPFQRSYDGQTFPAYLYDPGVLCVAKAEYGGKTEYLYFPCEEEAIDKAFARLGTTADEVKITLEDFNTDSPEWFGRFREIAAEEGVYELNRLTGAVNTADMDLKKLWSVAEYAEAEDAEQLTRLARNIGCFTFIEGATGYAEVGRFFTETEDRYILDLEMEDYFDYEGFGEYISDKFYGKFVCGGFIYNDTDSRPNNKRARHLISGRAYDDGRNVNMITAIIRNRENTLVLDFPRSIYDLYEKLRSIGIMQPPKRIPLTDNEDEDIGVKLFSESDFGQHLLLTLHEKNTIADANMLTLVIGSASDDIKDELEQNILYDQYDTMDEVINAVRQMTQDAGPVRNGRNICSFWTESTDCFLLMPLTAKMITEQTFCRQMLKMYPKRLPICSCWRSCEKRWTLCRKMKRH